MPEDTMTGQEPVVTDDQGQTQEEQEAAPQTEEPPQFFKQPTAPAEPELTRAEYEQIARDLLVSQGYDVRKPNADPDDDAWDPYDRKQFESRVEQIAAEKAKASMAATRPFIQQGILNQVQKQAGGRWNDKMGQYVQKFMSSATPEQLAAFAQNPDNILSLAAQAYGVAVWDTPSVGPKGKPAAPAPSGGTTTAPSLPSEHRDFFAEGDSFLASMNIPQEKRQDIIKKAHENVKNGMLIPTFKELK